MKRLVLCLWMVTILTYSRAQVNYQMSLANGELIDSNTFEFEVFIKSQGNTFDLTYYQCSFTFNTSIVDSGSLSFVYIPGTSELTNPPSIGIGLNTSDGNQELTFASMPGSNDITSTVKRVGSFRLQNTNTFNGTNLNILWDFEGNITTILTGSNFSNITVPSNHIAEESPTPVELVGFTANQSDNQVRLTWSTASEINNKGFEINRSINGNNSVIGFVEGKGSSSEINNYKFTDETELRPGIYSYRLKQIDYDGTSEYSDEVRVEIVEQVKEYTLLQNYPNPFNPVTKIRFHLPEEAEVVLTVYNSIGEQITNLVNERLNSGSHEIEFNAVDFASGVYFYQLDAGNYIDIKKMIVMK